jgi:polysaccharide chain length determinant protein (PEP-CTERM system associated)
VDDSLLGAASHMKGDPAIIARISALEDSINELLLHYTTQHPDVVAAKRLIQALEERLMNEQQVEEESGPEEDDIFGGDAGQMATNPVYQQVTIALSQAEANVASLKTRVKEYSARVEKLQRMIHTIPAVEAEYQALIRDHGLNKRNYQTILARLESVKMAEDAKQSGDTVSFRVIDPPRVPLEPSGPNRPLFISIVFAGSLLMGGGFALFMSLIKPRFTNARTLIAATGWPVIGGVSMIWDEKRLFRRRMDTLGVISIFVLLSIIYSTLYVAHILNITLPIIG